MIDRRGVRRAAAPRGTPEHMRVLNTIAAATSIVVILVTGYGWSRYRDLSDGLHRSAALSGLNAPAARTSQNILLMGLDSRLDENGDPLPSALYQAMDTGGPDVGGHNANVLMLLHIPADGSRATVISIPRDDYGDEPAAAALGRTIGIAATRADPALPTGHLRVVLGTGYQQPRPAQETGLSTPNPTPSEGTSTPADAITGGRIPCVK